MSDLERIFQESNPVHQHEDGTWWFYEETWADENGPFETEEACNTAVARYAKEVLGP